MSQYNYSKLLGKIKEAGLTQAELAKKISINPSTLNLKLKGKGEFSQSEIQKICTTLQISAKEITLYFFCTDTLETQSFSA